MGIAHRSWPSSFFDRRRSRDEGDLGLSYEIVYAPIALGHLRGLDARQRALVIDTVERQLTHQPQTPTRNRKRLRPNPIAPWELRIGDLRVFYDVIAESQPDSEDDGAKAEGQVFVLGVGVKRGSRLWLGDEECEL
jgi:mRNA-degrading endonuclease RelE of RelBE toxin-antitoxin system